MNKKEIVQKQLENIRTYEQEIASDNNVLPIDREIFSIQIENGIAELLKENKPKRRVKRNVDPDSKLYVVLDGYKDYWTYADGIYESENTVYHQAKNNKNLLVKDWPTEAKAIIARLLHMTVDQLNAVAEKVFIADDIVPLNEDIEKANEYGYSGRYTPRPWYEFAGTKLDPNTNMRRPYYREITGSAYSAMRNVYYYFFKGEISGFNTDAISSFFFKHAFDVVHDGKKMNLEETIPEIKTALLSNQNANDDELIYHTIEGRLELNSDEYRLGSFASRNIKYVSFKKSEIVGFLKQINDNHNAKVLLWKSTIENFGELSIVEIIDAKNKLGENLDYIQIFSSYRRQWSRDIYKILSGDLTEETAELKYEFSSRNIPEHFPIT